jgi:acylphosphatase
MAPKLLQTDKAESPLGVEARLRWYEDGSVRVLLQGSPWAIVEAFMAESPGDRTTIFKFQPGDRHPSRRTHSSG